MSIKTFLGNTLIGWGRRVGRGESSELAVELSEHSIDVKMVHTNTDARAWDSTLYKRGNVFVEGYANPIKPTVDYRKELEDPDTVDVVEGNGESQEVASDGGEETHVSLISSPRYRDYMRQDLISQLLNPREKLRLLAYGIIALGILIFLNIIVVFYATGSF